MCQRVSLLIHINVDMRWGVLEGVVGCTNDYVLYVLGDGMGCTGRCCGLH